MALLDDDEEEDEQQRGSSAPKSSAEPDRNVAVQSVTNAGTSRRSSDSGERA